MSTEAEKMIKQARKLRKEAAAATVLANILEATAPDVAIAESYMKAINNFGLAMAKAVATQPKIKLPLPGAVTEEKTDDAD